MMGQGMRPSRGAGVRHECAGSISKQWGREVHVVINVSGETLTSLPGEIRLDASLVLSARMNS